MYKFVHFKEIYVAFGERVRQQRKIKGFTQKIAAEHLGISVYKLRDIEYARSACGWHLCLKICRLFDIDLSELEKNYAGDYVLNIEKSNQTYIGENKPKEENTAEKKFDFSFVEK